jgi:hypothetical protein
MSPATGPNHLNVALKEWASVCHALETGRQTILLRKGGIYESAGEFEVEHPAFLLLPTYLHQKLEMIKPSERAGFEPGNEEPAEIVFSAAGVVTDIIELHSRRQMERIEQEHIWTAALIDMRFNYRPENPLYLLLVRAYRLKEPIKIPNTPAYLGCKSWVRLDQAIDTGSAIPVLGDAEYKVRQDKITSI